MGSKETTVAYILEQAGSNLGARKMFGEYGLYLNGKMVALVCDDQLYVKPTQSGRAFLGSPVEAPPYPSAKPCFMIPGDRWDDGSWLAELLSITASELPPPARRRK